MSTQRRKRGGFSYLELQVSMVLFAIALGGVGPLAVVHSRHISRIEQRFPPDQMRRLAPAPTVWERKLGAPAETVPSFPPLPDDDLVIDDGGVGYSQINKGSNDWSYWSWSQAYKNDMRLNRDNDEGDIAIWNFQNLQPGKYRVYVTWRPLSFMASNAKYEVFDGTSKVGSEKIDQRKWPDGPYIDGKRWERVDTVDISGTELRIELADKANGYIAIDGALLRPIINEIEIKSLSESPETDSAQAAVEFKVRVK